MRHLRVWIAFEEAKRLNDSRLLFANSVVAPAQNAGDLRISEPGQAQLQQIALGRLELSEQTEDVLVIVGLQGRLLGSRCAVENFRGQIQ